jgi:hypothetical protein
MAPESTYPYRNKWHDSVFFLMSGVFICVAKELLNDLSAVWVSLDRILCLCSVFWLMLMHPYSFFPWRSHALEQDVVVASRSRAHRLNLSGQLSVQYKDLIESAHGIDLLFPYLYVKAIYLLLSLVKFSIASQDTEISATVEQQTTNTNRVSRKNKTISLNHSFPFVQPLHSDHQHSIQRHLVPRLWLEHAFKRHAGKKNNSPINMRGRRPNPLPNL